MSSARNGFSLIELLIVVLILGILAVITTPFLRESLVRARTASSYTNLKTMDIAIEQFVLDRGVMLVEDDEYYYTSWGKERVETAFHGVGANRIHFKDETLYPLTSPIPYLSHLMEDPFFTLNAKARYMEDSADSPHYKNNNNGLNFAEYFYLYGDNDPAENVTGTKEVELFYRWGEGIYKRISLYPGEYVLWGKGPLGYGSWGVIYNPSNGILSQGAMILYSSEGVLQ